MVYGTERVFRSHCHLHEHRSCNANRLRTITNELLGVNLDWHHHTLASPWNPSIPLLMYPLSLIPLYDSKQLVEGNAVQAPHSLISTPVPNPLVSRAKYHKVLWATRVRLLTSLQDGLVGPNSAYHDIKECNTRTSVSIVPPCGCFRWDMPNEIIADDTVGELYDVHDCYNMKIVTG